jgi:hypothetical protein
MSAKRRNVLIVLAVVILVALNVYTGVSTGGKAGSSYPGYPSILLAYYGGNITILIHGALGPYMYRSIQVSARYIAANGTAMSLSETEGNTYYLGMQLHTVDMSLNSSALDSSQNRVYYFNATVTVNTSAPGSSLVSIVPKGDVHIIILGQTPYVASMEGRKIA